MLHRGLPVASDSVKPQSHQAYDQVTTYLRQNNVGIVANRRTNVRMVAEVAGDREGKISRSKVVDMFKTQSHGAYDQVTTYLRSNFLESWANRRKKNVRLVAEVVRLLAEVVGDRKGQISRNKVDGHVQNL